MGGASSKQRKKLNSLEGLTYRTSANDTDSDLRGEHLVKVVKVYDGDTITVAFDENIQASVRLAHIDCAELRPGEIAKSWTPEEQVAEHQEAISARDHVADLFGPKMLASITVTKRDKYRRLLAEVYTIDGKGHRVLHVNKHMIDTFQALPYEGKGTRERTGTKLREIRELRRTHH
jgi:endonuclease YncB( thermonuclease family)